MNLQEKQRQFQRVEEAFYAALDLADGETRDSFVEHFCQIDPGTGEQLRALLESRREVLARAKQAPGVLPRFGPWQAVRVLGRGGMGTVYLAERADGAFRMQVAVKVVPLALASHEIEERFLHERQFLAMLEHPGIARLLDGGVSEIGLPYLAMEFVDGETVDRHASRQGLDDRERIAIMRQLLDALEYVHSQNVLHRDLKPSNVLVDRQGRVRLVDFGIARLIETGPAVGATTQTATRALTPDYASPEQTRGDRLTGASDIYSAGLVLAKLMSSEAKNDPKFAAILRKATASDIEERYDSARAMAADLDAYVEGRQTIAERGPARLELTRKRRNGRPPAVVLAAVLVLATAGRYWWNRREVPANSSAVGSIAVLPFVNQQSDPQARSLADEITDRLQETLARNRLLLAVGKSSSTVFRDEGAREIGKRLKVSNVLEGRLEKAGDRIRVQARILRTADGEQIWSGAYDRPVNELNTIEDNLNAAVAAILRAIPGIPPAQHQPKLEAMEWLMRGRHDEQALTPDAVARAEADYRKAIEMDPAIASAYVSLATTIMSRGTVTLHDFTTQEVEEMTRLCKRALELDPLVPGGHAMLGRLAHQFHWDWVTAEREYTLATAGAQEPVAETSLAALLVQRGRFAEAEPHIERALRLDPYGASTLNNLCLVSFWMGRREQTIELAFRYREVAPNSLPAQSGFLQSYVWEGRADQAWPGYAKLRERFPVQGAMMEAWARAIAGQTDTALNLLRPLEEKYPESGLTSQSFALAYGYLGDEANTLKWLDRAADRHEWQVLNMGVNPAFKDMENSSGFHRLKRRIGLE